ncbi:biopolymer transporter ExbD [Chitinispirillales bacterium ANBcel5]|uniref:biopolymer transporter ExbD n=1 Tax=Cellulosispirillum alkaliphilum TaxID=3039283 RepID=UPI002A56E2F5|nr:biopolymer transporter ExbD [Chitinispirillales bacterium ANBcel5]
MMNLPSEKKRSLIKRLKMGGKEVDLFDLDVTPVMNLFMVLIPFLVSMAVFTHIAVIDFRLPSSDVQDSQVVADKRNDLDLSVVVSSKGFRVVGTGKKLNLVPIEHGQYNFDTLKELLRVVKLEYPSQESIILVFEGGVLYENIVRFMDICRELQFEDIGLSGDIG